MLVRLRAQVQGLLRSPALKPLPRSTWCFLHFGRSAPVRPVTRVVLRLSGLTPCCCTSSPVEKGRSFGRPIRTADGKPHRISVIVIDADVLQSQSCPKG